MLLQRRGKDKEGGEGRMKNEKFIVRLYDGFDNEWIDVSSPNKTKNGAEKTKFNDIDYYDIFPADTIMYFSSPEGRINK